MDVRESEVENAIKFLLDRSLSHARYSDKISFLKEKGLSDREVDRALETVEIREKEMAVQRKHRFLQRDGSSVFIQILKLIFPSLLSVFNYNNKFPGDKVLIFVISFYK